MMAVIVIAVIGAFIAWAIVRAGDNFDKFLEEIMEDSENER